jgi:sugar lactone lactonase YvrE
MKRITFVISGLVLLAPAAAHAQDLLVGEYFTNTIWRVAPDGTKTLFAQPAVPSGIRLCGFSFDAQGNLYAARVDGGSANPGNANNGVIKITPMGQVTSFSSTVSALPIDTAVDSAGNVYVGSYSSGQIHRYSSAGADLGVFATMTTDAYNIAFDTSGVLFAASYGTGQIRRFSSTGADLGVFATIAGASSLAFDAVGNLYAGTANGVIQRYSPTGVNLGTFATVSGANLDGLAFALNGELYATNYQVSGGDVRRFSASGVPLGTFSSGIASPFGIGFVPSVAPSTAPEPSTLALISFAALGFIARRRKNH